MSETTVRVFCRFRPLSENELKSTADKGTAVKFPSDQTVQLFRDSLRAEKEYTLDRIFDSDTTQEQLYESFKSVVIDVMTGFNATIFAYGQTGSGKTHSMFGANVRDPMAKGIIPRAAGQIFDMITADVSGSRYVIKVSFLEIYKEQIRDLLQPKVSDSLRVRESPDRGVYIENLTEECVSTVEDIFTLISHGEKNRTTAATCMNEVSSRSHSLLAITVQQHEASGGTRTGVLNLVDLAGSEKIAKTGATGVRQEEGVAINASLSSLGLCIFKLSQATKQKHIPYRDSKLTFILRESLGGNSKTTLLCACSPHIDNQPETISTLDFASRAKAVKLNAHVNKVLSVAELGAIANTLRAERDSLKKHVEQLKLQLGWVLSDAFDPDVDIIPGVVPANQDVVEEDESASYDPKALEETMNSLSDLRQQLEGEQTQAHARIAELSVRLKSVTATLQSQALQVDAAKAQLREASIQRDELFSMHQTLVAAAFRRKLAHESELEDLRANLADVCLHSRQLELAVDEAQVLGEQALHEAEESLQTAKETYDAISTEVRQREDELLQTQMRQKQQNSVLQALLAAEEAAKTAASATMGGVREALQVKQASVEVKRLALQQELDHLMQNRASRRVVRTIVGGTKSVLRNLRRRPTLVSILEPIKQGLLKKRTDSLFHGYASYWFALRDEYLYYLSAPDELKPDGIICLEDATVERGAEPYTFVITQRQPNDKHHVLLAESDEAVVDWLLAIQTAVKGSTANQDITRTAMEGRILAMDACDDTVFIGTSAGQVIRYGICVTVDFENKAAFTVSNVKIAAIARGPVVGVKILTSQCRLFVLCAGSLIHYDALQLNDAITVATNVDNFCVDENSLSADTCPRVCVVRGEELQFGTMAVGGQVSWHPLSVKVPRPRQVIWKGDFVVVAHDHQTVQYSLVQPSSGSYTAVVQGPPIPHKMMSFLRDIEQKGFLVLGAKNTVTLFLEVGRNRVESQLWIASDSPNAIGLCGSNICALLPDGLEVYNLQSNTVQRSKTVRNAVAASMAAGYIFVATTSDICLIDVASADMENVKAASATGGVDAQNTCSICKHVFTTLSLRKYQCHNCKRRICHSCSVPFISTRTLQLAAAQRVCSPCAKKLESG
eukprot:TRINITY_DN15676_c0_g1_i1.p1 TRINITY_DN15676_c0_g1~~TRINITY_DN15676_c0_g1_i1.p1  ORF type:complete len:1129 (-),score=176.96 TRINITY_DN15676_c0_g1_i1:110-3496(-)